MATWLRRRKAKVVRPDEVVCEQRGATLMRRADGSTYCKCPFACMATYESCEFATP